MTAVRTELETPTITGNISELEDAQDMSERKET